jgi:hypothetical protein
VCVCVEVGACKMVSVYIRASGLVGCKLVGSKNNKLNCVYIMVPIISSRLFFFWVSTGL